MSYNVLAGAQVIRFDGENAQDIIDFLNKHGTKTMTKEDASRVLDFIGLGGIAVHAPLLQGVKGPLAIYSVPMIQMLLLDKQWALFLVTEGIV